MRTAIRLMKLEYYWWATVEWIADRFHCWRASSFATTRKVDAKLLIRKLEKLDN